jgi:hypothetical protein
MTKDLRTLSVRLAADYTTRTETFDGREYLVVPVVGLVETVVHASNAANAELVTAEEFSKVPIGWNGRPVFHGHPQVNGTYVSGNEPGVLESLQIGMVFNTHVADEKLKMEAWLDVEKTKAIAPALLERIAEGEIIQISVGLSVATAKESGVFDGKKYEGVWKDIVPDHLAILPEDEVGACSVEAGCGVRAATGGKMSEKSGGVMRMLQGLVRQAAEALRVNQSAGDMSVNDIRQKLGEALRKLDPRVYYADDFYPEKGEVVYSVYNGEGEYKCFKRAYTLSEDGAVSITGDPTEVQAVLTYEPVGGSEVVAATETPITATTAPCSCQHPKAEAVQAVTSLKENGTMTKDELKAQIDAMTTEQLAGVTLTPAAPAAVVETPAVVAAPVVATAAPTFQSLLDAATPETREAFAAVQRTLAANKAAAIKALKDSGRCKFSDEKLAEMSQADLDNLVALTGVQAVAQAVDFGVNAPRVASVAGEEPVAPPPDLVTVLSARK